MKNNPFEKTKSTTHRKKKKKNTKIPKLFLVNQSCFYGRLKLIRSQCGANLDHVNQKNAKKNVRTKKITTIRYIKEKQKTSKLHAKAQNLSFYKRLKGISS